VVLAHEPIEVHELLLGRELVRSKPSVGALPGEHAADGHLPVAVYDSFDREVPCFGAS
jgi:hypothetical protein